MIGSIQRFGFKEGMSGGRVESERGRRNGQVSQRKSEIHT